MPALHHSDESACLCAGKMIRGRISFCLPMRLYSFLFFFLKRIQEHGPHFFTSSRAFCSSSPPPPASLSADTESLGWKRPSDGWKRPSSAIGRSCNVLNWLQPHLINIHQFPLFPGLSVIVHVLPCVFSSSLKLRNFAHRPRGWEPSRTCLRHLESSRQTAPTEGV